METTASTGKRAVWYIVGLNLIAAAVVLNVRYNVGVAAFSSVMYAISEIYRISLGTASIICYLIFVVMQCILSSGEEAQDHGYSPYKPPHEQGA